MSACNHCGASFTADRHPRAAAAGNFYCDESCRTAHILGRYSPRIDRRAADRRMGDRRMGERRAS